MRQVLTSFLKIAFAVALITYFIRSGKIDVASFKLVAANTQLMFLLFGLYFVTVAINNFRWQLLLLGQGIRRGFRQTMPLTFIGLFFNLAIPGAVGGDLIKAMYIAQEHSASRARAAMSVGMDRLIGLFSMLLIAFVAGLLNLNLIFQVPQLKALFVMISCAVFGFFVFLSLSFSSFIRNHPVVIRFLEKVPGGKVIEKLYDAIHAYRHAKTQFILGIALSLLAQGIFTWMMYIISVQLGSPQSWAALLFVVPLGLITMAIPISPGGIGVGQVAFYQLFSWYSGTQNTVGGTLITVIQFITCIVALCGSVFYFTRKAPPTEVNLEETAIS